MVIIHWTEIRVADCQALTLSQVSMSPKLMKRADWSSMLAVAEQWASREIGHDCSCFPVASALYWRALPFAVTSSTSPVLRPGWIVLL